MADFNSRTETFTFRISKGDRSELKAEADRQGVKISELVYKRVMKPWGNEATHNLEIHCEPGKTAGLVKVPITKEPSIDDPIEQRQARAIAALSGQPIQDTQLDGPPPDSLFITICGHDMKDQPTNRGCKCQLPRPLWIDKRKPGGRTIALCEECSTM